MIDLTNSSHLFEREHINDEPISLELNDKFNDKSGNFKLVGTSNHTCAPHVNALDNQEDQEEGLRKAVVIERKRTCSSVHTTNSNDFRLLEVIGRGTFADQVALAQNMTSKAYCVIKSVTKEHVIRRNQVQHTIDERRILEKLHHPFIVNLVDAFQTPTQVHFVLEWCPGGELFFHLQERNRFLESEALFYTAEVLLALEYLHSHQIIYRDLKPENVMLDKTGHVKLIDFGFASDRSKCPNTRTRSFLGSPEYLSPEMIRRTGHSYQTDVWAFGIFCFELLTGSPPFQSSNLDSLFKDIQSQSIHYPDYLSIHATDLLSRCLQKHSETRPSMSEIMEHPFFNEIDWKRMKMRDYCPPITPQLNESEICTENFDPGFTSQTLQSIHVLRNKPKRCQEDEADGCDSDVFWDF